MQKQMVARELPVVGVHGRDYPVEFDTDHRGPDDVVSTLVQTDAPCPNCGEAAWSYERDVFTDREQIMCECGHVLNVWGGRS